MRLRQRIARGYWRLSRWTVVSEPIARDGAGILIAAPHTAYWDFVHMLAISAEAGISVKYLAKKAFFRPPLGWFMRALGGIPVDRSSPQGLVEDLVARVRSGERFYLVISPEGTRSAGTYWKSGFYRIALETGLPITLGYVDRTTMTAGLGPTFTPSGDVGADMDVIRAFYADKAGHVPARRTQPRLREEDNS
ncbi:Acyltransferase [Sanguibacter gelidistatuariae]|uniref:Acyltransferase n=1 Tax=Sanguibacter gelidistatuariae TaxID=1814289 RepID=A0A1G6H5D9_9MICO|nr:1-acyl-sn-glycerol-3-phosphate acyltransferase [Sanguibacter gelidistatuariae]SDB89334.1 Acyltransferase [Sanguibacter gelidistatuariae]